MKKFSVWYFVYLYCVVFQLIEGTNTQQKEGLGIMTPDYYYYLNQSGTYKVDGTNDSKDFQETMVLTVENSVWMLFYVYESRHLY